MINWGEIFYDHFTKFFGDPTGREVFQAGERKSSIQVLHYGSVFPECRVFCSLGMTHYSMALGEIAEVSLVSDDAFDKCGWIFSNSLFYLVRQKIRIGRGVSVGGILNIDDKFAKEFDKHAIYFTRPYSFPEGYEEVMPADSDLMGKVYWAFFISKNEHDFLKKQGADEFESLLEKKMVDPFSLERKSVV